MSTKKLIPKAQSGIQFQVIQQPAVADNTRYVQPYNSIEIAESKKAYEQEQLQKQIEAAQKRQPQLKADTRSTTQRQRDHNRAIQQEVRQKANEQAANFGRALGANHDMTVDEVNQNTLNTVNLMGYMTAPYLMTALESGYYGATRRPKEAAITAGVGFGLPIIFNGMQQLPNTARSYIVSRELKRGIKQATKLDETVGIPGQIGWAPKQTFTGYHASNEKTFNPNFWYENWARTTHNAPYGIYIAEGTTPTKGFLSKRPYVHNVTVELEKPMVQIGELQTNTKNSTRNGLERFAQKQGADAIIFQDIKDNQMNHQNILKTLNPDTQLIINNKASTVFGPNSYVRDGSNIPTLDEILNPGMQFIRALRHVPIVNENGFVELVPKDNMLANFATDMRAANHSSYGDLYEMPALMFINESQLKGITPFSIKPSDTFFRASDLRNRFKPQDITYWSYDEGLNETARSLGFNVPKTPADLLAARDAHRATIKGTKDGKGKVSMLERLKKTEQEQGDRDLGEKANLLRRQFEQSLYRRPSLEDYKLLETKTGLKADVTESEISKLNKVVDEYKNARGDVNKIEELYKKYGDDPVITLSDGTSFGHDDLVTLSFGTDNTVGDKLSEMLNATLDHRYDKIYYDRASSIESELMKSIGMGSHPRLINGRVVGAKGVGDMSLEEFNEALNNLRKRLGAKPLAKGGKLIRK